MKTDDRNIYVVEDDEGSCLPEIAVALLNCGYYRVPSVPEPVRDFLVAARKVLVGMGKKQAFRMEHAGVTLVASAGHRVVHLLVTGPVEPPEMLDTVFLGRPADRVRTWPGGWLRSWEVSE